LSVAHYKVRRRLPREATKAIIYDNDKVRDDQSTAMRHLSALFRTAIDLEISTAQQFAQAKSELVGAVESQGHDMAAKLERIQPAIAIASVKQR